MQVNLTETIKVNGTYKSQLYANYYGAEFLVNHGGVIFFVRYPYGSQARASAAVNALRRGDFKSVPTPDHRPIINLYDEKTGKRR